MSRSCSPELTPGGTVIVSLSVDRVRPAPRHVGQGSVIRVPLPPQVGHAVRMRRNIWAWTTSPMPLHVEHVTGFVPSFAPLPPQVSHRDCLAISTSLEHPWTASRKS